MIAEFEADLISTRTKEGMRIAKAKGRLRGRGPKLTPAQEAHLVKLYDSMEYTAAEVAELTGVSRATVYRIVHRHRASTPALPKK
jgi:DNA invertase Pin-like site-specific DNA recombinase